MNVAGDQPLRITIALSLFHPTVGGAENQMLELGRRWVAAGHRVQVLTRAFPGRAQVETVAGVVIRRAIHIVDLGPLFGVSFLMSLAKAVYRSARNDDIVIAGQGPWEAIATGAVARRIHATTIVRLATTGPFGDLAQLQRAKGRRWLTRWFLRNQAYWALSAEARAELLSLGVPATALALHGNGVDGARFAVPPSTPRDKVVLFVGRLADQKDPLTLVDAWKQIAPQSPDWRLRIVGAGPLAQTIEARVRAEQIPRVELAGSQTDMPSVYRDASVFALPSLGEGICNALLEAMAAGLCPVVSAIGGNRDVLVDHENGLLSTPGDAGALANALARVINDDSLRLRLANSARQTVVQQHELDAVASRLIDWFRSLRRPT